MNDEFRRERARTVRSIADNADPFTKKRLLDLAERYEDSVKRPAPSAFALRMIDQMIDQAS